MNLSAKYLQDAQNYLYGIGQYDLAYQYALKAFIINQDNFEIKYTYAVALYFNNKCNEALEYFFELEKTGKYLDAIYVYIAHCLSKTRKNLFLALKYIEKAITCYEYDKETQINTLMIKAEIQYRMGDYDTSLKNFLKAYEMGDDDKSLCYIAKIYLLKNEFMKAMKYMRVLYHFGDNQSDEIWEKVRHYDTKTLLELLEHLLKRYEIEN